MGNKLDNVRPPDCILQRRRLVGNKLDNVRPPDCILQRIFMYSLYINHTVQEYCVYVGIVVVCPH